MPGTTAQYTYKADNMRISKTVNGTKTSHVWDGSNMVADLTGTGEIVDIYTRGMNLISSVENDYYLYNAHGDVVGLSDNIGSITREYVYDAFGVELNKDENDTNPLRYCGEYLDLSSGLYYLRHRYYDPAAGRFLTEDPIRDGLNWYVYVNNNPVTFIGPFGLAAGKPGAVQVSSFKLGVSKGYYSNEGIPLLKLGTKSTISNVDEAIKVLDHYMNPSGRLYPYDTSVIYGAAIEWFAKKWRTIID